MKISIIEFYNKTKIIFKVCKIKNKIPIVVFFIFCSTLLELFGIGMLIPITSLFIDPNSGYSKTIISVFFENYEEEKVLTTLLSIYLVIFIVKNIFLIFIEYYKSSFIHHIHSKIVKTFYSEYLKSPISFFFTKNTSYLTSVLSLRVPNYIGALLAFAALLSELMLSACLIVLLLILTPYTATTIAAMLMLIILSYNKILKKRLNMLGLKRDNHETAWIKNFTETLNFLKEINIFNATTYVQEYNNSNSNKFIKAKQIITFLNSIGKIFFESVAVLCLIGFLFFTSIKGGIFIDALPLLAAYVAAAMKFLPSLNKISNGLQFITFNMPTTDSIIEELDYAKKNNQENERKIKDVKNLEFNKSIKLKNIGFSYPDGKKVLNNLNLDIKKGETVAIIGESGLGKSTLIEIMCGFLEPQTGAVLIDDKNLNEFSTEWKKLIGYVPQQTFIVNDSIRKNVGLWDLSKDNIDDKKVLLCLKAVGLSKFLESKKNGLDTVILEGGKSLSGGQKQRISIARNMYKGSKIIFLDEPTSALDDKTEDEILKELELIKKDTTLIIVTHKKKIANFCDKIIDLSKINYKD